MSTHAILTARLGPRHFRSITVLSDGYVEHCGKMLVGHFTDAAKIKALMELGNVVYLRDSILPVAGHSYETFRQNPEHTLFMGRDMGRTEQESVYGPTAYQSILRLCYRTDYYYLWQDGQWTVNGSPVADVLAELELENKEL